MVFDEPTRVVGFKLASRCVRSGEDHYSLTLACACMAVINSFTQNFRAWMRVMKTWAGG